VFERDIRDQAYALRIAAAMDSCQTRLESEGIDLSGYNSAENAADLQDLRVALGYEQWNLYGISYGTRLALTAMRDQPLGIRSVILDSTYPPQVDLYAELVPDARRAFTEVFEACRADRGCNGAYPNLEGAVFDLAGRLDAKPAELEVWNPATDRTIHAKMNGDLFLAALFQSMYSSYWIEEIPATVFAALGGDTEALTPLAGDLFFTHDSTSNGMHYAVQCREEAPFGSLDRMAAAAQADPVLGSALAEPVFGICQDWALPPAAPRENEPVRSDIPTFVLAGEFDPITPPAWGRLAADTLARGYYFEFPGVGHGASVDDICPLMMTLEFLDNPNVAPDSSCIAEMAPPEFLLP
jgi:pimeloyl-ACP methyl ester carboxylesterase